MRLEREDLRALEGDDCRGVSIVYLGNGQPAWSGQERYMLRDRKVSIQFSEINLSHKALPVTPVEAVTCSSQSRHT